MRRSEFAREFIGQVTQCAVCNAQWLRRRLDVDAVFLRIGRRTGCTQVIRRGDLREQGNEPDGQLFSLRFAVGILAK